MKSGAREGKEQLHQGWRTCFPALVVSSYRFGGVYRSGELEHHWIQCQYPNCFWTIVVPAIRQTDSRQWAGSRKFSKNRTILKLPADRHWEGGLQSRCTINLTLIFTYRHTSPTTTTATLTSSSALSYTELLFLPTAYAGAFSAAGFCLEDPSPWLSFFTWLTPSHPSGVCQDSSLTSGDWVRWSPVCSQISMCWKDSIMTGT